MKSAHGRRIRLPSRRRVGETGGPAPRTEESGARRRGAEPPAAAGRGGRGRPARRPTLPRGAPPRKAGRGIGRDTRSGSRRRGARRRVDGPPPHTPRARVDAPPRRTTGRTGTGTASLLLPGASRRDGSGTGTGAGAGGRAPPPPLAVNDPSAGSPTETLLRLLLPLDSQVRPSSQRSARAAGRPRRGRSEGLTKPSNR